MGLISRVSSRTYRFSINNMSNVDHNIPLFGALALSKRSKKKNHNDNSLLDDLINNSEESNDQVNSDEQDENDQENQDPKISQASNKKVPYRKKKSSSKLSKPSKRKSFEKVTEKAVSPNPKVRKQNQESVNTQYKKRKNKTKTGNLEEIVEKEVLEPNNNTERNYQLNRDYINSLKVFYKHCPIEEKYLKIILDLVDILKEQIPADFLEETIIPITHQYEIISAINNAIYEDGCHTFDLSKILGVVLEIGKKFDTKKTSGKKNSRKSREDEEEGETIDQLKEKMQKANKRILILTKLNQWIIYLNNSTKITEKELVQLYNSKNS